MEWPPKLPRDFPLTLHPRGYVKKGIGWICGKKLPQEALEIYHRKALAQKSKHDQPPKVLFTQTADQTVDQLAERWLVVKLADARAGVAAKLRGDRDAGDETTISFSQYSKCERAASLFVEHVCSEEIPIVGGERVGGLKVETQLSPDVFSEFGRWCREKKGRGYAARHVKLVMAMFRHADAEDWIDRPVKFGKRLIQMSRLPRAAEKHPPTAEQIRKVLDYLKSKIKDAEKVQTRGRQSVESNVQLVAAIYLAINGGYGARDLAEFPKDPKVVDLTSGVIDYRRGKTDIVRRVPLIPESIEWLRRVWKQRTNDTLVFRTREGNPLAREVAREDSDGNIVVITNDSLNQAYSKVLRKLGFKIAGNGFYKIKDLHCTAADECGDDRAARLLTGHAGVARGAVRDVRDAYINVSIERQRKIVQHIRQVILLRPSQPSRGRSPRGATPVT